MKTFDHLSVIGLHEWIGLPDLGLLGLRAKIDTGAGTSALHATDIQPSPMAARTGYASPRISAPWCSAGIAAKRRWWPSRRSKAPTARPSCAI